MKKVIVGFVVAAAFASASMAAVVKGTEANDQSSSTIAPSGSLMSPDRGIVVGGNLGYSYAYGSNTSADSSWYSPYTLSSLSKGGFAWNLNAGYQLNSYV